MSLNDTLKRCSLPVTLVQEHNERTNVQKPLREVGKQLATGKIKFDKQIGSVSFTCSSSEPTINAINLFLQSGFEKLGSLKRNPELSFLYDSVASESAAVDAAWMKNHDVISEVVVDEDTPCVRIDTTWFTSVDQDDESIQKGLEVLAAFAGLQILCALCKRTQREMLHTILDVVCLFPREDVESLHRVFQGKVVDANHSFSIMLAGICNQATAFELEQLDLSPLSGVPSRVLFDAGNRIEQERFKHRADADPSTVDCIGCLKDIVKTNGTVITKAESNELIQRLRTLNDGEKTSTDEAVLLIEKTLKWRDTWVTWIISQGRVDTPYDQARVVRLMAEEMEDVDEKRALINEAISSTYDLNLEGENIQRISNWARESGMRLVAGRLSRAFGNQAHLLSVAKILADKEGLLPYVKKLHKTSMGIPALQTQATRLLHLIQQRKPTPFAQTVGALNHFEEALFDYQTKEFKTMLTEKDEASRRIIGRPDAKACGDVLDTIQGRTQTLYQVAADFRDQLEKTEKKPAAFIVFLQRLHPAETVNLANANLLRDVHPGKENDLRDLTRQGGDYTYSSTGLGRLASEDGKSTEDTNWILEVDDWIEAIPLFIHERVVQRTMKVGNEEVTIEVIETEVDQEAMEVFFRLHAEFWAQNINAVMDSEHVGLARRLAVQKDTKLSEASDAYRQVNPDANDDVASVEMVNQNSNLTEGISALAVLVKDYYCKNVETVSLCVETDEIPRIEALEKVLAGDTKSALGKLLSKKSATVIGKEAIGKLTKKAKKQAEEFAVFVNQPARKVPSLHILTTESAGMTEGYVQTWIEEEIALYNVIRNNGFEDNVTKRIGQFRERIQAIGRKVIAEFGMSVVIDEVMAQQRLPEPVAVLTVLTSYKPVMDEAAKLAVLIEQMEKEGKRKVNYADASDPKEVDTYLKKNRSALTKAAIPKVALNNGKAFEQRMDELRKTNKKKISDDELQKLAIESEEDYREELEALVRFEARTAILDKLHKANPDLCLPEQVRTYIRMRTGLGKSTARKEIIAQNKLNAETIHSLNYYQAAGGNKRYNLLYTPSRVNLGERERDSVVKWRQWVGGADRWAAHAGFEFYSQINEGGVEERPALAYAEIQKTSENALCVTHFAGSNALALLCMAVLEGDAEDMADQMNLRHDRMVPAAGEGYGGYCVPKDGLFLAFVLSLQNEVKLRQIGIPERYHEGVMKMAKEALLRQNDFESHFAWQKWAAEKLLTYKELKKYFDLKDDLIVFQITKIAEAVENLGQPWYETTEGSKLVANLAAQWGVEKMIIRAEQVNRFMVFYKAWMIYDAIREANLQNPDCPVESEAVVAVSAEYKPVQDVRFSTGMRLFEIMAQTGDHLFHSLDEEGQNLAQLMFHGFDPDTESSLGRRAVEQVCKTLYIDSSNKKTIKRLKEAFPPHQPPRDIVITSVTMSSIQDLLYYTSDTKLEEIAMQIQVTMGDYGLTEDQIRANATVYGGALHKWAGIKELPKKEQDELIASIGGGIHALVLQMRGPGRGYENDIQGIDVLNTGIPFDELLDLLDNMPKVISLMRNGKPNSSLAITDGAAGRARRCLTYFDIQLFFAACEQIGRQGVYRAVGLGKKNIQRLRDEMHRKRERSQKLFDAVVAVANAKTKAPKEKAAAVALSLYQTLREDITLADEAGMALREEEKMKRYNKWKKRDYYVSQALAKICAGLPLQRMDFGTWIAGLGGVFAITGEAIETINEQRDGWNDAIAFIAKYSPNNESPEVKAFTQDEQVDLDAQMIRPRYVPETQRFAQQMLVESSSKAVEIAAREALERRKALKVRAERARAFNDREDGFRESFNDDVVPAFDETWATSQQCLKTISSGLDQLYAMDGSEKEWPKLQSKINHAFGQYIGLTRAGLTSLFVEYLPESNADQRSMKQQVLADLSLVFTGREIIMENLKKLMGGYEDIGAIARLAESVEDDQEKLAVIAKGIELFYNTFALAQTLEFAVITQDEIDPSLLWKNIVDFFAESINDHWYEYWPWAYSRGVGFRSIEDEDKFAMAVERHAWLYEFMRKLFVNRTELCERSEHEQDLLLGNYTGKKTVRAIGANAPTENQLRWRAYNQLRELAFIKTDGFEFPPVIENFDPAIIEADTRVNVAFLFPIGRTHVSRALREGPTLNANLQKKNKPGTNIIITRYNEFVEVAGAKKKALLVEDGHLYITQKEYEKALKKCVGLKKKAIAAQVKTDKAMGRITPKGIRIAARFMQDDKPSPIVAGSLIPFHGLPLFVNGQSEEEGMPATIQSQIYGVITYDKSVYPEIFTEETKVQLPPEIDWLQEWNADYPGDKLLEAINEGIPKQGYKGIRKFAHDYPIILIKGAAESGARNLKVFEVQDDKARINEEQLMAAARFVSDVSRGQNVVIQAAVFTNPELWASPELMEDFVERQVLEWNTPVNRDTYPRSQIYGSMRIVTASSGPKSKYETAFPINLMSLQVATNVGRGGTLDILKDEYIQPQFRQQIMEGLHAEGPKVMKAMNEYVKRTTKEWEEKTGLTISTDLRGVSYGWANYLMCDYVIMPEFKRRGRLVDIEPIFDDEGRRVGSTPILQDEEGRFVGEITKWEFIHLEPNVGIGLWDRYNLREEFHETRRNGTSRKKFDYDAIGQSDRVVLKTYVESGGEYLNANFGKKGISRESIMNALNEADD